MSRHQVLKAVEKAGGRVTVQDVAALAGVDILTAQKGLVKLATLVEGDLEVGTDGDLVYQFPRNFRTALRTRSVTQRAKEVKNKDRGRVCVCVWRFPIIPIHLIPLPSILSTVVAQDLAFFVLCHSYILWSMSDLIHCPCVRYHHLCWLCVHEF